jgi:hypothetical protein
MNVADAPANARLLRYFTNRAKQYAYRDPTEVHGTHPDLVMRLWDELGTLLPEDCHAVVHGSPALVRPSSGIIFAFAGGTHTYAMRLPADVRDIAMTAGATRVYHYRPYRELDIGSLTFDLKDIGDEWVFCHWLKGEEQWCLAAYEFATNS